MNKWAYNECMNRFELIQGVLATSLGLDNDVFSLNELIGPRICVPSPPGVFRICSFDGTRTSFGRILL